MVDATSRHADDYVIATGQQCSVRDFVVMAASAIGLEIEFRGSGLDEAEFCPQCRESSKILSVSVMLL